ncbi:MAG: M6 family metalloprotease domain-containing protein [Proteobacteria bacterium]|nr:M6 family metalloprotease domain-containing protein [Pseudomonadota bacterium]
MCLLLGKTRTFPQGDGPGVQLRVFGDEFYARYETLDGYTVIYDTRCEKYCFAILIKGHLASSGCPMDKPVPQGLVRHLQEDKDIRNKKFDQKFAMMRPAPEPFPGVSATLGENKGLLPGKQLSRESRVTGLTILIHFKNETSQITPDHVRALLNGDNFTSYGNFCSVKEYYQTLSSGRLEYINDVVGPVVLSKNKTHYIENPCMGEALSLAVSELNIDLGRYDCTGRGTVDAINFLYAGETLYEGWLWPHNHVMDLSLGGIKTNFYTIQSLGRQPVDMKIGTFCHESGHLICRFPDLYDYGSRDGDSDPSSGMGYYCLMAAGSHLDNGRTPSPICAYLRNLAGWTDQVFLLNDGGEFQIEHGDYKTLYKYQLDTRPNEYFLVENRSRLAMDQYCTSHGLAVYHCDILGSNEWQGGTGDSHYQCALVQADGARHLENNVNNGDEGDLFRDKAGLVLSHDTVPSSRVWGGVESGFQLYDIGSPGQVMGFNVGDKDEPDTFGTSLSKESRPSMLIPDNAPEGISDSMTIATRGTIERIRLSVDITHTYIGDLMVELMTPQGKTLVLREKKGGDTDDLIEVYDSDSLLATLVGQEMKGLWTLKVSDHARRDTGKLRSWKIEVDYIKKISNFSEDKVVNRAIPDNDPQGIMDSITLTQGGSVKRLTVSIDITHSYHGDLMIRLVSPSGKSATLVDFNTLGSASGPLARDYSDTALADLKAMIGEPVTGDWTLHVSDNWLRDTGTLNRWSLSLHC